MTCRLCRERKQGNPGTEVKESTTRYKAGLANQIMSTHAEKRSMPYTQEQIFDLIADIEQYPVFLPWCTAARIRSHDGNILIADLVVGFKMVRETFTSRVELDRPKKVNVTYAEGPFIYMNNHWVLEQSLDGGTIVDFYIDFEFRSKILQKIMGTLFNEAVRLMVSAFQKRAAVLYGPDGRKHSS